MLNQTSIDAIATQIFDGNWVRPMYGQYCFSGIPGTIERLLSTGSTFDSLPASVVGGQYKKFDLVILLFIDAFGWRFLRDYADSIDSLKTFSEASIVSKLTSQFPSTTTNHATMIHTSQQPGATGLYEYFQYDVLLDSIVAPLRFSTARSVGVEDLHAQISHKQFYAEPKFHKALQSKGVKSYFYVPERGLASTLNNMLREVGTLQSYSRPDHAFDSLAQLASGLDHPAYINLYYPDFDALLHQHGPGAKQPKDLAKNLFNLIQDRLLKPLKETGKRAALLLCADHGMMEVSPKRTVYLNQEVPELLDLIPRCASGELRTPSGSPRDYFLHLLPGTQDQARKILETKLEGRARIFNVSELVQAGFFGNQGVSERFLSNIGDLVILPEKGEAVWWFEKGIFEQTFFGMHGGLSPEEMEIPFFYLEV